jgi:DNA primase
MLDNAELQRRLDEIRSRYRISDVARRRIKLRRAGAEWTGLCPFHHEKTPSFTINDVKAFYHCFGCGAHGDIIRFVQGTEGVSFREALDMIDGGSLPEVAPSEMVAAREAADEADRQSVQDARLFWDNAGPVSNTPADLYLCWRRIFTRPPEIRFGRVPSWKNPETGRWNAPRPALLLKAENLAGDFVGIQRIFLTEDGGKAAMENPKLSLGRIRSASGAVRLGRPAAYAIVTGSSEDGLTLFQRYNEMVPVYISCGESNLPFLSLPRLTRKVGLAGQNDRPGQVAARKARHAFEAQGRQVFQLPLKPCFKDFNDEERGIRMDAAA